MSQVSITVPERIKLFDRYWTAPVALILGVEALAILGSVWAAYILRSTTSDAFPHAESLVNLRPEIVLIVVLSSLYFHGLYDLKKLRSRRREFVLICRSMVAATLFLSAFYFFVPGLWMGRTVLVISVALIACLLVASRLLVQPRIMGHMFSERVLVVGNDSAAAEIGSEILARSHLGYRLIGFMADGRPGDAFGPGNAPCLGAIAETGERAVTLGATRVVVAVGDRRGKLDLDGLLDCKIAGIPVEGSSSYYEQLTGKVLLDGPRVKSWLIFNDGFTIAPLTLLCKRLLDLCVAMVMLILALPLMVIAAAAIKLDSHGPVLYRQRRLGRNGREFSIIKFRSMIDGAEARSGPRWAEHHDARITRIGNLVRRCRIDELPQLWNVLIGDMSLVGPRPERPEFVKTLRRSCKLYEKRLAVRPGITGWAQIMAPYAASVADSKEKLKFDLYYIKNLSVFLDLSILASTVRTAAFGTGAR